MLESIAAWSRSPKVKGANRWQTGHDLCTDQTRDEVEEQLADDVHLAVGVGDAAASVLPQDHGLRFGECAVVDS